MRKTNRGKCYSNETLTIAVTEVLARRLTLGQVGAQYKIPKAILNNHVKGRRGLKSQDYGRLPDIPKALEDRIAEDLRSINKWGLELSRSKVLDQVQAFFNANHLQT